MIFPGPFGSRIRALGACMYASLSMTSGASVAVLVCCVRLPSPVMPFTHGGACHCALAVVIEVALQLLVGAVAI